MLAKRYQSIRFVVWVSIKVKLNRLCGNILSTCQYFKPKFCRFFITALLFLICAYSLNVPVVSYLRIIVYDRVCMLYVLMYFAASAYQLFLFCLVKFS